MLPTLDLLVFAKHLFVAARTVRAFLEDLLEGFGTDAHGTLEVFSSYIDKWTISLWVVLTVLAIFLTSSSIGTF